MIKIFLHIRYYIRSSDGSLVKTKYRPNVAAIIFIRSAENFRN
jgi:hypothetical protein